MNELFSDNQIKTQMNNLWGYLDELAEKNPEEYKKFLAQQFKRGFEQKEEEKKIQSQEESDKLYQVTPFLCLRYKVLTILEDQFTSKKKDDSDIKIFDVENKNEISEIPKILFSFEFLNEAYTKKIMQEPKIYLNIVHSSEFSPPTDDNGHPLKNPADDSKWRYIPSHVRYSNKKKSLSGKRCDFYDILVNTVVVERMRTDETLKKSILAYLTKKFCNHLENEIGIRLFTENVKILSTKKYKSVKGIPESFKIISKNNKKNQQESNLQNHSGHNNTINNPIAKNFLEENKINIPNLSENFPNTPTFYNLPKENKNTKNPPPKKKEESNAQPAQKKNLIEEIKQPITIPYVKEIESEKNMKVYFEFNNFEGISLDHLDLQISSYKIKINIVDTKYKDGVDYIPVDLTFDLCVDPEKCTAKFNKENKILAVYLERI
jgi:hypothetical protein